MKTIIKTTDYGDRLIFEKCSRKDMSDIMDNLYEMDSNSTVYWRLDNGQFGTWSEDEIPAKKPPISRIIAWIYSNEESLCFYGEGKIVKNDGLWELRMEHL